MSDHSRSTFRVAARALAVGLGIAVAVAACGSATPTPAPQGSPTPGLAIGSADSATPEVSATPEAPATPAGTPSPTAPAIYPVPTSRPELPAAAPAAVLDSKTAANLQAAVNALRVKGAFPGMSVAVAFPDGSMWTGQSGSAVLSSRTPVTAGTLFSIGSISKTFVAALALRLAERGAIGLDDPLSRYAPKYPNASHITLRELLDHRSGIHDVFTSAGMADAILSNPNRIWTVDQVLARIGKPYFAPGRGYTYSNTNYILLGVAIEKATGKTIASLVRSEFLDPLGMKSTWFQPEEKVASTAFAHGYMTPAGKPRDVSAGQKMLPYNSEASVAGAAGGFVSTAPDLARWAAALYGGGVLDEAALASMIDVSPTLPYKPKYPYGLGFEENDGFWSAMWYLPDSRGTIVVLTNDEWTNTQTVTAQLVQALLGK